MCWSIRVYLTVLHNLFIKFCTNIANFITNNNNNNNRNNNNNNNVCSTCNCRKCFVCCRICRCKQPSHNQDTESLSIMEATTTNTATAIHCGNHHHDQRTNHRNIQHDYVIVDEIDANYLEIERRKIETECYYRTIDRTTAEDFLMGREDGACLVRPFREPDISIKYIVSVYAQHQFFHLFIREIFGRQLYGIGQQKPNEKLFASPTDIIEFYSYNSLCCTNKNITLSLLLKPIIA